MIKEKILNLIRNQSIRIKSNTLIAFGKRTYIECEYIKMLFYNTNIFFKFFHHSILNPHRICILNILNINVSKMILITVDVKYPKLNFFKSSKLYIESYNKTKKI